MALEMSPAAGPRTCFCCNQTVILKCRLASALEDGQAFLF